MTKILSGYIYLLEKNKSYLENGHIANESLRNMPIFLRETTVFQKKSLVFREKSLIFPYSRLTAVLLYSII